MSAGDAAPSGGDDQAPKFGRRQPGRRGSGDSAITAGAPPSAGPYAPTGAMVAPLNVSIASSPTSAQGAAPAATGANWVDDIVADVDAIPDLSDEKANAGLGSSISAPVFQSRADIQSLNELDREIGFQLNSNADGCDLSLLTRVLFAPELLEEPDVPWSVDMLLSQIASDMQIAKDNRQAALDANSKASAAAAAEGSSAQQPRLVAPVPQQ
ncbi:Intraflagellar transport protein 43 [Plasmodiophora brassicae]